MTIEELRNKKLDMQQKIANLLKEFHKETGLGVQAIDIDTEDRYGIWSMKRLRVKLQDF